MNFEHILYKHGVLSAFNIVKKIKQSEIRKIRRELKKTCKNADEINEKLQLRLTDSTYINNIPGLMLNGKEVTSENLKDPFKNISDISKQKLVNIALITNKLFKQENFEKELILVYIQIILAENKITNEDIKKFTKKYKSRP